MIPQDFIQYIAWEYNLISIEFLSCTRSDLSSQLNYWVSSQRKYTHAYCLADIKSILHFTGIQAPGTETRPTDWLKTTADTFTLSVQHPPYIVLFKISTS